MGWGSAGQIFNPIAEEIVSGVENKSINYGAGKKLLIVLIRNLQMGDWDTEEESLAAFRSKKVVVDAFRECGVELPVDLTNRLAVEAWLLEIIDEHYDGEPVGMNEEAASKIADRIVRQVELQ